MAEDEEHTLRTFRGHKEVFEKLVQLHRGRVFNTAGDAILAEFGSAVEAVRCATEIQAALRTRNDQLPEDRQVKFRIGVNLGDVMVQGQDLLGDGVNVAARLQGAAEPGGICIAGSVYDQIRNKLSLSFTPLGEMSYKNIPQPVRTFAIAGADGLGSLPSPARRRRAGGGSIIWVVAAAIFLMAAVGAAVWGYSDYRNRQAEAARAAAVEQARRQTEAANAAQQQAELAAGRRAVEEARRRADAEQQAAQAAQLQAAQLKAQSEQKHVEDEARRLSEDNRKTAGAEQLAAASAPPRLAQPQSDPPRPPPAAPRPTERADLSGLYRGQICYGPGEAEPARCYRAQAVVLQNRISGEWPGRSPGVTVYLSGRISPAGDVEIHMHGKRAVGSRVAVSDMIGKLRSGQIDAAGSFRNGRSVSLNWQKN